MQNLYDRCRQNDYREKSICTITPYFLVVLDQFLFGNTKTLEIMKIEDYVLMTKMRKKGYYQL